MTIEPISKTIESVIKELSQGQGGQHERASLALMSLLDNKEKQHARPGMLRGAVLTLYVDSPTRMYAFNLKKASLLEQLQLELGQGVVKDIKLRIGRVR